VEPSSQAIDRFKELASHHAIGHRVCGAIRDGRGSGVHDVREWCTVARVPQVQGEAMVSFLEAGTASGLFEKCSGLTWRAIDSGTLVEMTDLMTGVAIYLSEIHKDDNTVDVVLSTPPNPSQMVRELEKQLLGRWGLLDTREMLPSLAEQARERFVVMSPFMDNDGVEILISLFRRVAPGVRRQLVIRREKSVHWPTSFLAAKNEFDALHVEVYGYWLEKEGPGNETFHAKLVLADNRTAYIGSSNMTKWSFEYSLELGLKVSGKAADRLADIVDAILTVSERII
jgi:hypothetical protein